MADSPSSQSQAGICYLVGAGPGDPGLMTLRGRECLERADVVVYDYLSNPDFLKWARPDAEKIYAGKKSRDHTLTQDQINALIVEKTRAGHVVTRLKGGDPLIFGRGGEEAAELRAAGVRFEIVPGISSSIAGPAYAYPRYATKAVAALLRLSAFVDWRAGEAAPATGRILVVTNAADPSVNNAVVASIMDKWRARGGVVDAHEFAAALDLPHDIIDPNQPDAQIEHVYPILVELVRGG